MYFIEIPMSLSYSPVRHKKEVIDCDSTEEKQPLGHFTPLMILCCALLHPKYLSWASAYSNLIYSDFKTSRQCMFFQVSCTRLNLCPLQVSLPNTLEEGRLKMSS